jgi:signal transduction histidine kinase
MMVTPSIPIDEPAVATTLGVGVGAIAGFVAGVNEARAIVRAERAASERVATELADEQRERLEWVNHLLRHDILNDVTVIRARADAIAEEHGEGPHVRAIHRQVDSVTELIGNVRTFLEGVERDDPLRPVDLSKTLGREVESLRSAYPEATVETEVPPGVTVTADDLLSSVFSNLLRNAIVHNRGDEPAVRVTTTVAEGTVTVRVADDGPGIPDHVRAEPFTAAEGEDHGFGLYLVGTLTERYGGTVEIERTGEDGTTIAVDLPLSDAAPTPGGSDTADPSATGAAPGTSGELDDAAAPEP